MIGDQENPTDDARDEFADFDELVAQLCDASWMGTASSELDQPTVARIEKLDNNSRLTAADQRWIDALLQRLAGGAVEEDQVRVTQVIQAIRGIKTPPAPMPDLTDADPTVFHPLLPSSDTAPMGPFGSLRWFPLVSVLALLLIFGIAGYRLLFHRSNTKDLSEHFIAKLLSVDECVWGGEPTTVLAGDGLKSGTHFDLLKGVVKLKFEAGATVVVEGPASFGLVSAKRMSLRYGSLVVRTDEKNKEFVVDSPDAAIVDLGTSFGVHCDAKGATEVSVFEGAVEVRPTISSDQSHVLGLGASARISRAEDGPNIEAIAADDRFTNLVDALWDDFGQDTDDRTGAAVIAEFNDAPIPGTVDTFYGSTRGRGWRTPWMAAGNPVGEVRNVDSLSEEGNPYLHMKFLRATSRLVAREYGKRTDFDPLKPHVISWKWRFDGNPEQFGRHFKDRVLFFGSTRFRTNTSRSVSWLIRLAAADEVNGRFRAVYPMHWCFSDPHVGDDGGEFNHHNLVDSGMALKPGIVYRFAVAVYPKEAKYDVAIRDEEETVVRTGLSFRSQKPGQNNVVHFGVRSEDETADMAFSLDSVRIEPLSEGSLRRQIQ